VNAQRDAGRAAQEQHPAIRLFGLAVVAQPREVYFVNDNTTSFRSSGQDRARPGCSR
jgi:hypothetical protein